MLQSISGLDRSRASAVLAVAAQRLIGHIYPESAQPEIMRNDAILADRVIEELQAQIERRADETEDQRLGRINDALSHAMSDTVLKDADLNTIRNRAGQKGTLPTSLYRVLFTPAFEKQAPLFAVKKSYVEDAVRHADLVEHLKPKFGFPAGVYVSLFVKTPRTRDSKQYTLLVKCDRIGAELRIDHAFYLFHDTFAVHGGMGPLGLLREFLAKFGAPIVIEGKVIDWLVDDTLTIPASGTLTVSSSDGSQRIIFSGEPGEKMQVLLVYGFNQREYSVYLREHGLNSKQVESVLSHTHAHWRP
jgi:hypothetical protein